MKKIVLVCLLTVLAAYFVSGCKNGLENTKYKIIYSKNETDSEKVEQQKEKSYTIAIIPKVGGIPYFNEAEIGAMEAAKQLNVEVFFEGPDVADSEQQIRIIEEFIEKRVDVIAVSANDPEDLLPVLNRARNENIKVITWDADTLPEAREFFINMVHPETLGRHIMDTLAWNTGEEGDYIIMTASLTAANLSEWMHWMLVQQEEFYPQLNLIDVAETGEDPGEAYIQSLKMLDKYPDLKGIIGNGSIIAPSAAQAVREKNKSGEVAVVGLSPPTSMREFLKDGSAQVATLWSPKRLGYLTVVLAEQLLQGKYPEDWQDVPGVGIIRVMDDVVIMGEPIDFTAENVDQYDF
ncbi:rhamnose transport system substrate-binding protein [Evansella caseinilytica]|uniref:Rhamnose transport system substrate-binding protein n=1 Tax=Evansella caseinilytica TaxID=1503961 RepID=A0A1H3H6Q6_9BACI|nr:autoinducer 2 ABC transporter substrate-binding protein [Evansella caseinilytica]SDY11030.1 rhamnose transport system substrate-binding protein [Evansella caseinilytica]